MANDVIHMVYNCYLGRDKVKRTGSIYEMLAVYDRVFFYNYSMPNDSILEFINKCDALGGVLLPNSRL